MPRKLDYETVKDYFETNNCILLTKTYKNHTQPLDYIGSCGHEDKTTLKNFRLRKFFKCRECIAGREENSDNKKCSICKKIKDKTLDNFNRKRTNKKGETLFNSYCKECYLEYQKKHYRDNKDYYKIKARKWEKDYKRKVHSFLMNLCKDGCKICGEKDYRCLQFNHLKTEDKTGNISEMICAFRPLEVIEKETKKCEILCANCHMKHKSKQFNWYNY